MPSEGSRKSRIYIGIYRACLKEIIFKFIIKKQKMLKKKLIKSLRKIIFESLQNLEFLKHSLNLFKKKKKKKEKKRNYDGAHIVICIPFSDVNSLIMKGN